MNEFLQIGALAQRLIMGIVSILIEAAVLAHFLRLRFGKALLMSLAANVVSLAIVAVLFFSAFYYLWNGHEKTLLELVRVVVFSSWQFTWGLMSTLAIVIELCTIKALSKYSWQQLWLPAIAMNVPTYLLVMVVSLVENWTM